MSAHHSDNATADLLFEIGTEELPPKALSALSRALGAGLAKGLDEHSLTFDRDMELFASPRRLGLRVRALAQVQPDTVVERRGPPLSRAFDGEGRPTKAAEGFALTCGVEVDALERLETDKGTWLAYRRHQPGRPARELLPALVQRALDQLPIPKRMHWNALDYEFVRPAHWAVLLLGEELIECQFLGIATGRRTRGHRFHHPDPLPLARAGDYRTVLEQEGYVVADFAARRHAIHSQVARAAAQVGGTPVTDEALLDEVTGLVEWPAAMTGSFDERFLKVPQEALISAMQGHQKCFPVVDGNGRLMPYFITVSNIASREPDSVRAGYERVIRPRLADADFFWNQDRREPLADRLQRLGTVVFQEQLGSLLDKARRLMELVEILAPATGADGPQARRAAELAKCDLLSRMVEEFPELQGTMGRYYARHDGEPEAVARAIEEQYLPRFAGDGLPATAEGQALALADKLDTLVGVFAIGQAPTGDKDPFALRRAALGVIRILIERRIDLDLNHMIERAVRIYAERDATLVSKALQPQVMEFITARLRVHLSGQGFGQDEVNAVLHAGAFRLTDVAARLQALSLFRKLPEAESLTQANKRIKNILRQAEDVVPAHTDPALFGEPQEAALAARIAELSAEVEPLLAAGDYESALKRLAGLRETVDGFFDRVMVMAEDPRIRNNRLALLHGVMTLFTRIADLSALQ